MIFLKVDDLKISSKKRRFLLYVKTVIIHSKFCIPQSRNPISSHKYQNISYCSFSTIQNKIKDHGVLLILSSVTSKAIEVSLSFANEQELGTFPAEIMSNF